MLNFIVLCEIKSLNFIYTDMEADGEISHEFLFTFPYYFIAILRFPPMGVHVYHKIVS